MPDAATGLVDWIFEQMLIDKEWSVRRKRGFTWWGKDHAQHVWADPPVMKDGRKVFRIHARTEVAKDVSWEQKHLETISQLNSENALSSLQLKKDKGGRLDLYCNVYVDEWMTQGWLRLFTIATAIQAALGQMLGSGDLIRALDAKPASSAHPKSGFRDVPDDMLNVIHQMIIPDGEAPCPLRPTHLSLALGSVRQLLPELSGSLQSETELHLVAPFPTPMVAGRIIARTADKHELLGNGLSVIFMPSFPPPGDAAAYAMELNNVDAESSEVHFLGSW